MPFDRTADCSINTSSSTVLSQSCLVFFLGAIRNIAIQSSARSRMHVLRDFRHRSARFRSDCCLLRGPVAETRPRPPAAVER